MSTKPRPTWRSVVQSLAPPILLSAARRMRSPGEPEWEYLGLDWPADHRPGVLWDHASVGAAYELRWPALVDAVAGTKPMGVTLEVPEAWGRAIETCDLGAHNLIMSYAYAVARTGRTSTQISVLDWGGGPGHYYLIAKALFPEIALRYCCKETPNVCERARKLLPEVEFVSDDSCLERTYDLVVASSSLHYAEDWRSLIRRLVSAARSYLYLGRVPFVRTGPAFTVLQNAHPYGYHTSYVGWVLNLDDLINCVTDTGMTLVRQFLGMSEVPIGDAETGGFLFAQRP